MQQTWNPVQFLLVSVVGLGVASFTRLHYFLYIYSVGWLLAENLFVIFLALPILWLQFSLGSASGHGLVGALRRYVPILQGFGWAVIIQNAVMLTYISVLANVALLYFGFSITMTDGDSPLHSCANDWNKDISCKQWTRWDATTTPTSYVSTGSFSYNFTYPMMSETAEEQFYKYHLFPAHDRLDDLGELVSNVTPHPVGILSVVWICVFCLACLGPSIIGYASYLLVPLTLAGMLTVVLYGFLVPKPDLHMLKAFFFTFNWRGETFEMLKFFHMPAESVVWSLGLLGATPVLLGKYSRPHPGWLLMILHVGMKIFLCVLPPLMFIPYFVAASETLGVSLQNVMSGGAKSWFIVMPNMFHVLDVNPVIQGIFYMTIFLFLLLVMTVMFLTIQETIVDLFPLGWLEKKSGFYSINIVISFAIFLILFPTSLIYFFQSGWHILEMVDNSLEIFRFVYVLFLVIALVIAFAKTNRPLWERVMIGVLTGMVGIYLLAVFIWKFVVVLFTECADKDGSLRIKAEEFGKCPFKYIGGFTENTKMIFGWCVATIPLGLGLIIGFFCLTVQCCVGKKTYVRITCGVNDSREALHQEREEHAAETVPMISPEPQYTANAYAGNPDYDTHNNVGTQQSSMYPDTEDLYRNSSYNRGSSREERQYMTKL